MDKKFFTGRKIVKDKMLTFILRLALVSGVLFILYKPGAFALDKVEDLAGRKVEVPPQIEKIVCAGPGALRLIVYLDATDKVVGVEDAEKRWGSSGRPYAIARKKLRDLPSIGPGGPGKLPDIEALVKLSPDVIFMTYVDARIADNIQEKTGIPVLILSYGEAVEFGEPLFRSLELVGDLLGRKERAEEIISFIKESMQDLKKRTENIVEEEKPAVYVGGLGYRGTHGIESSWAKFPPFVFVGAKNVVDEVGREGHVFIDKEKLIEWDPEVIFIDEGGLELVRQDYQKRPNFYRLLKAFRQKSIYGILPFNFYATNIGTSLADAYYIGKVLYPDKFWDIEPEKKADKIYTFLLREPVYKIMRKDFGGFGRINLEGGSFKIEP